MTLYAYPVFHKSGMWHIRGNRETYNRREELRNSGASWDGFNWTLTDEQLTNLGIQRMIRVEVESCHESPQMSFVTEFSANVGDSVGTFCGMCDSHSFRKILRIVQ